jgi:hypothetical protein
MPLALSVVPAKDYIIRYVSVLQLENYCNSARDRCLEAHEFVEAGPWKARIPVIDPAIFDFLPCM